MLTSYISLLVSVLINAALSLAWLQERYLDDDRRVKFYWTADSKKNVLLFEVQARTRGYVGIGISPNGTMYLSDMMIGYVDGHGESHITDYWSEKNGVIRRDPMSQNWRLIAAHENSSHTMLRVRRPLQSPDLTYDLGINNAPTWIIWAWHPDDPEEGGLPKYHGNKRGAKQLCMIYPECASPHNTGGKSGNQYWYNVLWRELPKFLFIYPFLNGFL